MILNPRIKIGVVKCLKVHNQLLPSLDLRGSKNLAGLFGYRESLRDINEGGRQS